MHHRLQAFLLTSHNEKEISMRTRLRFAALALAGMMSLAVSARPGAAAESDFGYCKMTCGGTALRCGAAGGNMEFCGGVGAGCLYGCGANAV
jgi:hypothetical protein